MNSSATRTALRRPRRAFSLIELAVVLIVIGVIAAIAIPTFQSFISETRDRSTLTTAEALLREASALAAMRGDGVFDPADLEDAFGDLPTAASAPGTAAAVSWTLKSDPEKYSDVYGVVHVGLNASSTLAAAAMRAESGNCAFARTSIGGLIEHWVSDGDIGENCNAAESIEGNPLYGGPGPWQPGGGGGGGGSTTTTAPDNVGVPGAPVITYSDASNPPPSIGAEWDAPSVVGSGPITSYTVHVTGGPLDVTYSLAPDDSLGIWVEGADVYYGDDGYDAVPAPIEAGTAYTISVQALNATGPSTPATVELTPPLPTVFDPAAGGGAELLLNTPPTGASIGANGRYAVTQFGGDSPARLSETTDRYLDAWRPFKVWSSDGTGGWDPTTDNSLASLNFTPNDQETYGLTNDQFGGYTVLLGTSGNAPYIYVDNDHRIYRVLDGDRYTEPVAGGGPSDGDDCTPGVGEAARLGTVISGTYDLVTDTFFGYTWCGGDNLQLFSFEVGTSTFAVLGTPPWYSPGNGVEYTLAAESNRVYNVRSTWRFWEPGQEDAPALQPTWVYDVNENTWNTLAGPGVGNARSAAIRNSHLYVSDYFDDVIYQIDLDTGARTVVAGAVGQPGNTFGVPIADTRLRDPDGLALNEDGTILAFTTRLSAWQFKLVYLVLTP